jgi:RNA polymerase sigma factor (sigma-70 family)
MDQLEKLVLRAQTGDTNAFGELVRHFQDMAIGYAYAVLRDFGTAEDVAQESFIRAFMKLRQLRDPKAFPAWFRTILSRECSRITRQKGLPTVSLEDAADVPDESIGQIERRDTWSIVERAIRALPAKEREVTTLFYINGYSMGDIGSFLAIPLSTVKNRLHSARNKLRERTISMVEETLKANAPHPDDMSERIVFLLDMAKEFERGIPLAKVLQSLEKKQTSERMRTALREVREAVLSGTALSSALAGCPDLFPEKVVSLVRDGECCGLLEVFVPLAAKWLKTGQYKVDPHMFARCLHNSHWFSDAIEAGASAVLIYEEQAPSQDNPGAIKVWVGFLMPDNRIERICPYLTREEAKRLGKRPEPYRDLSHALGAVQSLKFMTILDKVQKGNEMTGRLRIRLKPEDKNEVLLPITFAPRRNIDEVRVDLKPVQCQ